MHGLLVVVALSCRLGQGLSNPKNNGQIQGPQLGNCSSHFNKELLVVASESDAIGFGMREGCVGRKGGS